MALPNLLLALALSAVAFIFIRKRLKNARIPLPPGPASDPLIGHLRLIPHAGQDLFFYRMGKIYGDMMHFEVLGQSVIILNSVQAAVDLLDKRGVIYSDRPDFRIYELFGIGDSLVLLKYGKDFQIQRRMVQQHFTNEKRTDYLLVQTREARILAQSLITRPEDRISLLLRYSTAIIMDIIYGHQIVSADDPFVKIAEDCCEAAAESGPPGATPVDLFPILKHFPSWFPGTYYATFARGASDKFERLREYPFARVVEEMAAGRARPSFVASQLEALAQSEARDSTNIKRIQAAAAIQYIAGAETTSSTVSFFFLAMVLYPQCQIQAQKEIDAVIGSDRLPEPHDRENLPFLERLLQETLRWNQAVPCGVPHKTMEDDVYKGMLIPRGSTVIANVRGMTLDESVDKDPFNFDPTRFLPQPAGRGEPYPIGPFGFGRRICPGRHLAEDSVWIAIATIMATISISRVIGKDGKEIIPDVLPVAHGIASHPSPFPCRLTARSDKSLKLLKMAESG
ncbi:putative cytochrome p450 [Lyophyllum shimeji]|uniref:Cytochrome p450 n=1 Tax=Lyophyllum shimeji TaxID=47721 RepID=A0A9P3UNQ9_LYOSH|nr:putative cytochrome p450 [Lyophyllum shimeji]